MRLVYRSSQMQSQSLHIIKFPTSQSFTLRNPSNYFIYASLILRINPQSKLLKKAKVSSAILENKSVAFCKISQIKKALISLSILEKYKSSEIIKSYKYSLQFKINKKSRTKQSIRKTLQKLTVFHLPIMTSKIFTTKNLLNKLSNRIK